jgi:hypothetical protein
MLRRLTDFLLPQSTCLGNWLHTEEESSKSQQDATNRPNKLESLVLQRSPDPDQGSPIKIVFCYYTCINIIVILGQFYRESIFKFNNCCRFCPSMESESC